MMAKSSGKKKDTLEDIFAKFRWLEQAFERLDEEGREPDDELRKKVEQFFEDTTGYQDEKLNGYAWVIRRLENEAEECSDIAAEFAAKAKRNANKAAWLKQRIYEYMKGSDQEKLRTAQWMFWIQPNGGKAPIEVVDEHQVPLDYWATRTYVDKTLCQEAIEKGVEIPGVVVRERGDHLRIK